ncbi:MAG TPA: periplasmic heavy metal sensor [Phycisphaerae bacterium]|nr:periplasmic heavy metal sensor [Phycisphaerae bacterium]
MKRANWLLVGACAAAALLSYLVTSHAAPSAGTTPSAPALSRWLDLTPAQQAQITTDDPSYEADVLVLRQKVASVRETLAGMLTENTSTDAVVMSQVDAVSAAENALQRRITQHILTMRQRLTPQQQANLMGLCAGAMRGQGRGPGMGRGYMGGRGDPTAGGRGRGYQGGRGVQ